MSPQQTHSSEWIDGFLFIGNHLALDFLNTKPLIENTRTELLPDAESLARWLVASRALTPKRGKSFAARCAASPQATETIQQLQAFRERLRAAVEALESGSPVPHVFLKELNLLLAGHPSVLALRRDGTELIGDRLFDPQTVSDVWSLIANAVADLLLHAPTARLRRCQSCVLHYYDTSKKGSRRWCSMNLCGNRIKVAAYQERIKASADGNRS